MQPLIDGDILLYEIGFASETGWRSSEDSSPPWWYVEEMLENRIAHICRTVEATSRPLIFLTGKTNFRNEIAKARKYKDRAGNKPYHYENIKQYLLAEYRAIIHEGVEADDLLAASQTKALKEGRETIICTRDKDLRQVPGWHFGWELGKQPQFGPLFVEGMGHIEVKKVGNANKMVGWGELFFYSQCLTGDSTDTVVGLPNCGPVKALKILEGCQTSRDAYERCLEAYKAVYEDAEEQLLEQAYLVWMVREIKDNKPVMWEPPNVDIN